MEPQVKNRTKRLVILALLLCGLLVSVAPASAQAIPVTIGENKTGELTASTPAAEFVLTTPAAQNARVQVLAITPGFAPSFTVIDATNGVPVLSVGIAGQATIVQGDVTLAANINYIVQVQSANGVFGQFVLSVQQGSAVQAPTPLTLGQPVADEVSPQAQIRNYSFTADPTEILLLNVVSEDPASGPGIALRDGLSGQTLAASSARLIGVSFRIPAGAQTYVVVLNHGESNDSEAYTLCLATESGTVTCPLSGAATSAVPTATVIPTQPQPAFTPVPIPAGGPCSIAPAGAAPINVRSGPSTSTSIVTQLAGNSIVPVTGRLADNSWYQINISGIVGWVSATVIRIGGICNTVTVITLPTVTPTAGTVTTTTTITPTATVSPTLTLSPTATATATIGPAATLNFSLPPNFGSTALTSGFVPDPFTVGITSGGSVNVSYLGSGCTGYATSAPDFSVNYTSGAFPTLRFYFIGSGDTTMIINTPGGSYVCVDDSFGTVNPTIDFNSPSGGRYDVWIGSYAQGASISGTLHVTENTGNHP
jgi:hypothetical protein